ERLIWGGRTRERDDELVDNSRDAGASMLTQVVQPIPEHLHAVQHFDAGANERVLAELRRVVAFAELVPGVLAVLILDPVVPGEERERQVWDASRLDFLQARNQF